MKKLLGSLIIAVFTISVCSVFAQEKEEGMEDARFETLEESIEKVQVSDIQQLVNNSVYKTVQDPNGVCRVIYTWPGEATVEQISMEKGMTEPAETMLRDWGAAK